MGMIDLTLSRQGSDRDDGLVRAVEVARRLLVSEDPWQMAASELADLLPSLLHAAVILRIEDPEILDLGGEVIEPGTLGGSSPCESIGAPVDLHGRRVGSLELYAAPSDAARMTVSAISAILSSDLERRDARGRLLRFEQLFKTHVESIPAITYIEDHDPDAPGGYGEVYVSPQVESMLGYSPAEWVADGGHWQRVIHPDDYKRVWDEGARTTETGEPFCEEYRVVTRAGDWRWIRDESRLVHDEDGKPLYWHGVITDITSVKEADEQVAFLAYHDALTGLPNRALLEEVAAGCFARASRNQESLAVLFLDLDGFKAINDGLGHDAGDWVLKGVADRLIGAVRESDVVCRLGGDEFLLLLSDLGVDGPQAAEATAQRIHQQVERPMDVLGCQVSVGVSIGRALYPHDASDLGGLLRLADERMYQQKKERASTHRALSRV